MQRVIDKHAPEFIGLQETKVQDHEFPLQAINEMGYQVVYMGQKTHYGVALLSRQTCRNPCYGFPGDPADAQKRFIGGGKISKLKTEIRTDVWIRKLFMR